MLEPALLELGRHLPENAELAVTVFRERIGIELSQEFFFDEYLHVSGVGAWIFSLVELDGLHVLIAAKDELPLPLPLHDLLPKRHRRRHRDTENHEPDRDAEEHVTTFAVIVAIHSSVSRVRS